jgi:outer membrane protease
MAPSIGWRLAVKTIKTIAIDSKRLTAAIVLSLSVATTAGAADWSYKPPGVPAAFTNEVGARVWFGRGSTGTNLYDDSGTMAVSRLTYKNYTIFTGEGFTRFDFNSGWFVKGYVGGGALWDGQLKDEDFPPVTDPYSATLSNNKNSSVLYGSVDGGMKLMQGPDFHLGGFVGYHLMRQTISANGCTQIASNPDICSGSIPNSVNVITHNNNWNSLRVGLEAVMELNRRWSFTVDAAVLPYVYLSGTDAHWLRIGTSPGDFTGHVPFNGPGWGSQFDAFLTYRFNDHLNIGLGGRYWHMQSRGFAHFDGHVVDSFAVPQVIRWRTDNFGAFIQSNIKLGPYPVFGGD